MLADFVTQLRAGVFPVFIGQTDYAFNGAVYPLRVAPFYQHLAGVLDLLTGRQLGIFALQHLCVLVVGYAGIFSSYLALNALAPGQRWSAAGDRDALTKNLQEAGSSLKSGSIYEYLAARAQTGKQGAAAREAAPWLKLAEGAYKDPADQLRIALTRASTLRRDGDTKAAAKVLEEAATKFARIPESEAARAYLKQLREQP
jgi:hypothetical protein